MKKMCVILCITLIAVLFSSFFGFGNDVSPKRKIAFKICDKLSRDFKSKYGLHYMGISEAASKGKYNSIGFELCFCHPLTKDQGRILLLDCIEDIVSAFKSEPQFRQHWTNNEINQNNVRINIFVEPARGGDVYHPEIGLFSFYNDQLRYMTYTPESGAKIFAEEREPFEKAWKIVDAQSRGELPFNSHKLASSHTRRESRRR